MEEEKEKAEVLQPSIEQILDVATEDIQFYLKKHFQTIPIKESDT